VLQRCLPIIIVIIVIIIVFCLHIFNENLQFRETFILKQKVGVGVAEVVAREQVESLALGCGALSAQCTRVLFCSGPVDIAWL